MMFLGYSETVYRLPCVEQLQASRLSSFLEFPNLEELIISYCRDMFEGFVHGDALNWPGLQYMFLVFFVQLGRRTDGGTSPGLV